MAAHIWIGVIGLVLLLLVQYDFCLTTLAVAHTGPLSLKVIQFYKATSIFIYRRLLRNRLLLSTIGSLTVVSIIMMWIGLTWFSWTLIFYSTSNAVVGASSGLEANVAERLYFTGFLFTTLGMGDFVPNSNFYRIVAAFTAIWGFIQFGLMATWLLNVSQAVASTRILAAQIACAGHNPAQVLINAWDGDSFGSLSSFFGTIGSALAARAQQEIFMPVLINFHPYERDAAEPVQIAVIDEALTLLMHAVEDSASKGIDKFALIHTHNIISELLDNAMYRPLMKPSTKTPPIPEISYLQRYDLPIVEDKEYKFRMGLPEVTARRRTLQGFVHLCGYSWKEVWASQSHHRATKKQVLLDQLPLLQAWMARDREVSQGEEP